MQSHAPAAAAAAGRPAAAGVMQISTLTELLVGHGGGVDAGMCGSQTAALLRQQQQRRRRQVRPSRYDSATAAALSTLTTSSCCTASEVTGGPG